MLLSRVFPELWKFGTHERAERRSPIVLWSTVNRDAAAARYSTFRKYGAAAGYPVTAAKTLIITRLVHVANGAGLAFTSGYSDADLGQTSAADGANPVTLDAVTTTDANVWWATAANTAYSYEVYYEIPATKYPRIAVALGAGISWVTVFGHEV